MFAIGALLSVVVTTIDRVCHDGMSDMPYPNLVTVEFPAQTFRGCGGDPLTLLQGDEWHVLDIAGQGVIEESREMGELYHINDAGQMRRAFHERNIARSRNEWLYPYDPLQVPLFEEA